MRKLFIRYPIWFVLLAATVIIWRYYTVPPKPVSEDLRKSVKEMVERHPELRPMYDRAMEDGS